MNLVDWRPITPHQLFSRTGDTHYWHGREWWYYWSDKTGQLRRHLPRAETHFAIVHLQKRPRTTLDLAKKFYASRQGLIPPRRYRVPGERPRGPVRPDSRPYSLLHMSLTDLNLVYQTEHPDSPPLTDHATAARRVRHILDTYDLVIVNQIQPHSGGTQVRRNMWLMPSRFLPDDAVSVHLRKNRWAQDAVVTVVSTVCPKRPGTAAAQRWRLYRSGMTVAELTSDAAALGIGASKVQADLSFDWERRYIEITRPTT